MGKTSGLGGASPMTFRPGDGTSILFETKQHQTFSKPHLTTLGLQGEATPGMHVNIDDIAATRLTEPWYQACAHTSSNI